MDKLTINGYIERLIDSQGHDEEARMAVAEFGLTVPGASLIQMLGELRRKGGKFSGYTPEHGQVGIDDDKERTTEFSRGAPRARIGHYKISRIRTRREHWIIIDHFWKADLSTMSEAEPSQQWALALDEGSRPLYFAERAFASIWRGGLGIFSLDLKREIYVESWGPEPGARHKGGILAAAFIGRGE